MKPVERYAPAPGAKLFKTLLAICIVLSALKATAQGRSQLPAQKQVIPDRWLGHWQKGTFSLSSFEDQQGKYIGPANEMSVSYVIEANGDAREYFISNSNTYNCRMQILGYRKGVIVVDKPDNSFEFRPVEGYSSSVTCMNKTGAKKPYGPKDLYPSYAVKGYFNNEAGSTVLITKTASGSDGLTLKKIR